MKIEIYHSSFLKTRLFRVFGSFVLLCLLASAHSPNNPFFCSTVAALRRLRLGFAIRVPEHAPLSRGRFVFCSAYRHAYTAPTAREKWIGRCTTQTAQGSRCDSTGAALLLKVVVAWWQFISSCPAAFCCCCSCCCCCHCCCFCRCCCSCCSWYCCLSVDPKYAGCVPPHAPSPSPDRRLFTLNATWYSTTYEVLTNIFGSI